jgi:hypothetical protein
MNYPVYWQMNDFNNPPTPQPLMPQPVTEANIGY